jgi:hypothetical protein
MPLSNYKAATYLFDSWEEVRERIRAARHLAVFLDFDGSLVPLRARPNQVWLDESGQRLLAAGEHPRVTLVLIRRRRAERKQANVLRPAIWSHGWEHRDGTDHRPAVDARGAPHAGGARGRPASDRRLGVAAKWSLPAGGAAPATLSIFGDGVSDEGVRGAARRVTVRVGRPRRTGAHFRLRNPGRRASGAIAVELVDRGGRQDGDASPASPGAVGSRALCFSPSQTWRIVRERAANLDELLQG